MQDDISSEESASAAKPIPLETIVSVVPGRYYVLRVNATDGPEAAHPRALVAELRFLNHQGKQLRGPYVGASSSARLGPYMYLPTIGEGTAPGWSESAVRAPTEAHSLLIRLRPWKHSPEFAIRSVLEVADEAVTALHSCEFEVRDQFPFRIGLKLVDEGPAEQAAVVAVEYLDTSGDLIPGPYIGCSESERFGFYFYAPAGTAEAPEFQKSLQAPKDAVLLRLRTYRWRPVGLLSLHTEPTRRTDLPDDFDRASWVSVGRTPTEIVYALEQGESQLIVSIGYLCSAAANAVSGHLRVDFLDQANLALTDTGEKSHYASNFRFHGTDGVEALAKFLVWRPSRARAVRLTIDHLASAAPLLIRREPDIAHVALPGAFPDITLHAGERVETKNCTSSVWKGTLRFTATRLAIPGEAIPELCIFFADSRLKTLDPSGSVKSNDSGAVRCTAKAVWVTPRVIPSGVSGVQGLEAALDLQPPPGARTVVARLDNSACKSTVLASMDYVGNDHLMRERLEPATRAELGSIEAMGPEAVIDTADALVNAYPSDPGVLAAVIDASKHVGAVAMLERAAALAMAVPGNSAAKLRLKARLAVEGVVETDPSWMPDAGAAPIPDKNSRPVLSGNALRVAHLFKTTIPHENTGGAIRCRNIVRFQKGIGIEPCVITPLGYATRGGSGAAWETEVVEGIPYHRLNCVDRGDLRQVPVTLQLSFTAMLTTRLLRHEGGVDLIQASSGYRGYEQALVGAAVASALDVPFVYEVRSYHEHAWRAMADWVMSSELTRRRIEQENRCMRDADAVVTICETMRQGLIERGVDENKIFVVPNSVDLEEFVPCDADDEMRERLGLDDAVIVGYISNVSAREGHAVLLRAIAAARLRQYNVKGLIVGAGPLLAKMRVLADELGISDHVVFTGEVRHDQISAFYSLIDIFVVPRVADFASDYVTPMKPFEAMAMNRAVIISDRPALREIVEPGVRGLMFSAGSHSDLSNKIVELIDSPELRMRLANEGRQWVVNDRSWSTTIKIYERVYEYARAAHMRRCSGTQDPVADRTFVR